MKKGKFSIGHQGLCVFLFVLCVVMIVIGASWDLVFSSFSWASMWIGYGAVGSVFSIFEYRDYKKRHLAPSEEVPDHG